MGRFNIDDILSQLGAPNAKAPVERVPSPKLAHATVGGDGEAGNGSTAAAEAVSVDGASSG